MRFGTNETLHEVNLLHETAVQVHVLKHSCPPLKLREQYGFEPRFERRNFLFENIAYMYAAGRLPANDAELFSDYLCLLGFTEEQE